MLDFARRFSVFQLLMICRVARHVADPDGFFNEAEHDYTRRRLHISLMSDGMHAIDGILDSETGAAVKTVLESLAKPRGPEDDRTRPQRMVDALHEVVNKAMDEGRLPRRNGVRPHVTVTATLEGLKNEVGAPPADLCYYHHRLVHEGGWQVIKAGREFRFLPPERVVMKRTRGPGVRWAA